MELVEILLPLSGQDGEPYPEAVIREIQDRLTGMFGGVTAFSRAPAKGLWLDRARKVRDDIVVVEVMVEELDAQWWADFRRELERRLAQDEIVIRAHPVQRL